MTERIVVDGWGSGPYADLIPSQDQRNREALAEIIDRPVRERSRQLAKQRDSYCRKLLEERMPDRLHWVIDRPRLLKRVLRLVPRWRPTLTIVNLSRAPLRTGGMMVGRTGAMHSTSGSAEEMARAWHAEQRERGRETKGVVFTYTDANGLPAEVYGP